MIISHPESQVFLPRYYSYVYYVRFIVEATGDNLMYQWQKDGDDIPGANSDKYYIYDAMESDEGEYRCVVSNVAGMVTSNAANLLGRYMVIQ